MTICGMLHVLTSTVNRQREVRSDNSKRYCKAPTKLSYKDGLEKGSRSDSCTEVLREIGEEQGLQSNMPPLDQCQWHTWTESK